MNPILEVRGVQKTFGGHQALREVNLSVYPGEIISVLGPSGCGKSTLLQIIAGLQQPDAGEVRLRGMEVATSTTLVPPEKRNINMVFQDYALWPHMTVYANIAYGLKRKKANAATIQNKIAELLALLRLEGLEERLPPQLSGGQQQRVAIARALATEPDLILLDEPLSNLDMRLRISMRTEMAYLFRQLGTTVFHVTHDPDEAFAMADRLVIMRAGAIDQIAEPEACFFSPATRSAAALLGAGNRVTGALRMVNGTPTVEIAAGTCIAGTVTTDTAPSQGEVVDLLFRPEDGMWREAAAELSAAENVLPVRVVHSTFEGSKYRILGETPDGQTVSYFHSERIEKGRPGKLLLPQSTAYLFPHENER